MNRYKDKYLGLISLYKTDYIIHLIDQLLHNLEQINVNVKISILVLLLKTKSY